MLLSEVVIEKLLFLAFQLRPGSPFILMPPSCPWLMFLEAFKVKSLLFLWFFPPLWGRGESFSSWTFKAPFPLFRQAEMAVQGCLVEFGRAVGPGRMPSLSLLWYFLPFGGVVSDYLV